MIDIPAEEPVPFVSFSMKFLIKKIERRRMRVDSPAPIFNPA
jgi:hypothetical protein